MAVCSTKRYIGQLSNERLVVEKWKSLFNPKTDIKGQGRKMKKGKWSRILAWVLCVGILTQSIPVYAENSIGQQEEAVINETVPKKAK